MAGKKVLFVLMFCLIIAVAAAKKIRCRTNEEYKQCGACDKTCFNPDQVCIGACRSGCFCKDGYVRSENRTCILLDDCP